MKKMMSGKNVDKDQKADIRGNNRKTKKRYSEFGIRPQEIYGEGIGNCRGTV